MRLLAEVGARCFAVAAQPHQPEQERNAIDAAKRVGVGGLPAGASDLQTLVPQSAPFVSVCDLGFQRSRPPPTAAIHWCC